MWLRCLVSWSQTGTWWNFPANRISRVVVTGINRKLLDTSHQARRDHQDRPWRLLESQHRKLTILSPPRLKYSSNNENTSIKSTAFWLSVWKKWCLEKGIAKEIENYEPTQLTLCSSDPMPKLKQTSLNLGNDDSISSKVIRTWLRLSNSLNCLVGLWTFLDLEDVKISLHTIFWIVRGCFDRTQGLNKLF